jgi:hypothetical protein
MIIIPEVMFDGERTLIYGMDPTKTLCEVCGEPASEDYVVISVIPGVGRLTHQRCHVNAFEQELLGHPEGVQYGTG